MYTVNRGLHGVAQYRLFTGWDDANHAVRRNEAEARDPVTHKDRHQDHKVTDKDRHRPGRPFAEILEAIRGVTQ